MSIYRCKGDDRSLLSSGVRSRPFITPIAAEGCRDGRRAKAAGRSEGDLDESLPFDRVDLSFDAEDMITAKGDISRGDDSIPASADGTIGSIIVVVDAFRRGGRGGGMGDF